MFKHIFIVVVRSSLKHHVRPGAKKNASHSRLVPAGFPVRGLSRGGAKARTEVFHSDVSLAVALHHRP